MDTFAKGRANMIGITRAELDGAVRAGIVSAEQADKLAAYLGAAVATAEQPRFPFLHVLYYLFGTLAIGAILLWRYRFPFMLMPIAVTLWYMSMDIVPFLAGDPQSYNWELRKTVSVYFGLAMTLLAFWVDLRSRASRDYAFWLYLFGVLTFWGGLTSMNSNSELGKLAYFGINVLMILIGAVLGRRVFAVFGGLGVAFYLGHLSQKVFKDSLLFPFALSLIGLAIIGLGVLWQRRGAQLCAAFRGV